MKESLRHLDVDPYGELFQTAEINMKAKIEFFLGLASIISTVLANWNTFSWIQWFVGLIAVVFFWNIWIKKNNQKE